MSAAAGNNPHKMMYGDWRLDLICLVNVCFLFVFFSLKSPGLSANHAPLCWDHFPLVSFPFLQ